MFMTTFLPKNFAIMR